MRLLGVCVSPVVTPPPQIDGFLGQIEGSERLGRAAGSCGVLGEMWDTDTGGHGTRTQVDTVLHGCSPSLPSTPRSWKIHICLPGAITSAARGAAQFFCGLVPDPAHPCCLWAWLMFGRGLSLLRPSCCARSAARPTERNDLQWGRGSIKQFAD